MHDTDLLQEYASKHSEVAFRALVERYLPLVYSAALRQVGNAAVAQDVTQVVFVLLARKAAELPERTVLTGWLYQTTRYIAAKALRQECRRRLREQEAMIMQSFPTNSEWEQWAPFLDGAMAQLARLDREAVLLRYFRNRSLREVGEALGLTEDTAQKRVSRAVGKLRRLLLKRGVAVSAVALTGLLATHAAQLAPEGLGAAIAAAALSKSASSAGSLALLQDTVRQSVWAKLAAPVAAALAIAGLTGVAIHFWPTPTFRPPSYTFQSTIVLHPRPASLLTVSSTMTSQPVRSNGASPSSALAGSSPLPSTPERPAGVTNAEPAATEVAANNPGGQEAANATVDRAQQAPSVADFYPRLNGGQQTYPARYGVAWSASIPVRGSRPAYFTNNQTPPSLQTWGPGRGGSGPTRATIPGRNSRTKQ